MAIECRASSTSVPNVALAALCVCVCAEWIPRTWVGQGDLRVADRGPGCAVCPPPACVCSSLVPRGSGLGVWVVLCAPLPVLVQIGVWLEVSWDWDSAAGFLVSGFTRLGCRSSAFLHLCAVLVIDLFCREFLFLFPVGWVILGRELSAASPAL